MSTTAQQAAARRVSYQLETLWDYDYVPTHQELETLYETAKKNQWNGSTAIDWSRPLGAEGPVLNVQVAFAGTNFFSRLSAEEQKEIEVRVSAWRLSQFLHGEQGALVVCGQLVNSIPELDAKLYASTQVVDEGRHVEVFERYVKKLHKIYPVDPLLKAVLDEILATKRAPCSPWRNWESRQADTRISTSFCSSEDRRGKNSVPMKARWVLSTGPSWPMGRLQSRSMLPFHWFFLAVS